MKNAVITGADGGMGTEITRMVAQAGYHVIMACKTQEKGEARKAELLRENKDFSLEVLQVNLASLQSVSGFADRLLEQKTPVSLLMNNAGTMGTCFEQTEDGLEKTVSVNYVAPYLLTRKLIPLMEEGSRIVNMVSCTHAIGKVSFPRFFTHGKKGGFRRIPVYSNTKFALTQFTFELAERLKDKKITVNAADPGIVSTEIIRMQKWFDPLTDIFFRPFIRKPLKGASTAIGLLLEERYTECTGALCASERIKGISEKHRSHPLRKELWDQTEQIVAEYLSDSYL